MTEFVQHLLKGLLAVVVLLLAVGAGFRWFDEPRRTRQQFIGNMFHERYEEAAGMLHPPSSLSVDPVGNLVIVDRDGRSISVPKEQLPFKAGGFDRDQVGTFKMTALGPRRNGILRHPPVALSMSLVGDEVVIETIER